MTNQKLYALRTSDTGEWVRRNPFNNTYYVRPDATIYNGRFPWILSKASRDTGHPCEWVEVWVIEALAVDDEAVDNLLPYNALRSHRDTLKGEGWAEGFRSCLRYLGVVEG